MNEFCKLNDEIFWIETKLSNLLHNIKSQPDSFHIELKGQFSHQFKRAFANSIFESFQKISK